MSSMCSLILHGNDFEHFELMKMTPDLDDPTGPIKKFSFFHSTLQEYLSGLYMSLGLPDQDTSIVWRTLTRLWTYICSYFWYTFPNIPLVLHKHDVLLRFLAGMCKHNSRLCEQVGNLVVSDDLLLVQCLDESDSLLEIRAIQKVLSIVVIRQSALEEEYHSTTTLLVTVSATIMECGILNLTRKKRLISWFRVLKLLTVVGKL